MKLIVIKKFKDKETGLIHNPNDIIEVNEVRGWEILCYKIDLATVIDEKKPVDLEDKPKTSRKKSDKKQES